MASAELPFDYIAFDSGGKRVKGALAAPSETAAFEQLKRQGLAPLTIRRRRQHEVGRRPSGLGDREASDFLADMAALLLAKSDVRTALQVIGAKAERPAVDKLCKAMIADIGAGATLERAFARGLGQRHAHVAAVVAAGEAASDLSGALSRAAQMLASKVKLRDQLISTLSYPTFVLVTSILALSAILLFVIPALAPLVQQPGIEPPAMLKWMIAVSDLLRRHALLLGEGVGLGGLGLVILARIGALSRVIDRLILRGPFRRTAGALIFGGFAITLGDMLSAGAPMAEALRLAERSVTSAEARASIQRIGQTVRQGQKLSDGLGRIRGFPGSIVRLAAIGEASGALGPMISRGGKLEEDAALRRIEGFGRLIGPLVIVVLGALVGLLMGGLLTSITHIGDSALQ